MKVLILGAGPAGLTLAYLLKKSDPTRTIRVLDRRQPEDPVGWGITFPTGTLDCVDYDARLHQDVDRALMRYGGQSYLQTPLRYSTISRDALVRFLTERCLGLGVEIRFNTPVARFADLDTSGFDLVAGADGANSVVRQAFAEHFSPSLLKSDLHYTWLATPKLFGHDLPSMFQEHAGALFAAWGYQFSDTHSTFIVECTAKGMQKAALAGLSDEESCRKVAEIFRDELDGQPVIAGRRFRWLNFELLKNKRWHHKNVVLLGDAVHTTHFSKGYGTELAIHDARALAKHLHQAPDLATALSGYERERMPEVARHQAMATSSHNWYGGVLKQWEAGNPAAVRDAIRKVESAMAPPNT